MLYQQFFSHYPWPAIILINLDLFDILPYTKIPGILVIYRILSDQIKIIWFARRDITWIHVFLHVKGCMQALLGLMQAWCEQKSSLEHSVWVSWKWKKKYNFSSMPYLLRDKPYNSLFFVHGFIWRSPCCHTGVHCTVGTFTWIPS